MRSEARRNARRICIAAVAVATVAVAPQAPADATGPTSGPAQARASDGAPAGQTSTKAQRPADDPETASHRDLQLTAAAEADGTPDPCSAAGDAGAPDPTASTGNGAPAALLLGGQSDGDLRTILVTRSANGVATVALDDVLVSPQPDGFWTIELQERAGQRRAFARPLDAATNEVESASVDPDEPPWRDSVLTVAQGVLCVRSEARWDAGGAHPTHLEREGCWPIEPGSPPTEKEPIAVADYFGDKTLSAARSRLREKHRRGEFRDAPASAREAVGPLDAERPRLMLEHRSGRLMADALAEASAPYALSTTYSVTLSTPLGPAPEPLAPYNERPLAWSAFRDVFPDAQHAFVSPGGAFTVLLTDRALLGVGSDGRIAHCEPVELTDVAVAEWATGDAALRWQERLGAMPRE